MMWAGDRKQARYINKRWPNISNEALCNYIYIASYI